MPLTVKADRGILTKDIVKNYIKEQPYYMSSVSIVEVENSHNRHGGSVYPIEVLKELYDFTKSKNIHLHMDGARVFNASIASKKSVKEIASNTDSITFCLSKGLGAPMGAMICGNKDFIDEAFSIRKLIGGGMRQIGLMAAACIYALEHNIESLEEDHQKAKKIAKDLKPGDVIVLTGELGSGKTKFTEGFLSYFNLENELSSPTFNIVNEYDTPNFPIYHFDVYRLEDIDEFYAIGGEEYFSSGICIIEWGEKIEEALPPSYLKISFSRNYENESIRNITIENFGNFPIISV